MQPLFVAVFVVLAVASASPQFFQPFVQSPGLPFNIQPPPFQQQFQPQQHFAHSAVDPSKRAFAHKAVLKYTEDESRLPPNLQNPFYKNPQIEAALAKESWFTPGEIQVKDREAEKIPRQKVYSILKHAGFIRRR